jgi:tRNA (guanine37-N1)-methyltransferase
VDDIVYGGGPGMLLTPEPVVESIRDHRSGKTRIFFMDPRGKTLNQELAEEISKEKEVFLVCGRYEGFDERIFEIIGGERISLGDFVLTGGELAALAVIDASARFIPGSLDSFESLDEESFSKGWLEYPHYTRPRKFEDFSVPEVLFSGNHREINRWKVKNSIKNTIKNRPDLLKSLNLDDVEHEILNETIKEIYHGNEHR